MAFLALFQFGLRLIPASEFTILQTGFNGMGGVQNTALPLSKYKLSILESANLNFFEHLFGQDTGCFFSLGLPPKFLVSAGM